MLDISLLLLLEHLFLYLLLPIIPGIIFIWSFFGTKVKGILLYIYSWFIGIGVVSFSIYNLQIFKFGIGKAEYFLLLLLLFILFAGKTFYYRQKLDTYTDTLKIKNNLNKFGKSYSKLKGIEKILTIVMFIYVLLFLLLGFSYNVTFPTYFDDSFGNWNLGAINMFFDGGYKVFGESNEIFGKGGRVDYPIFISIFKALVANFVGFWYDIYQNMYQYITFFFLVIFSFIISFQKTENIFLSIIPATLLTGISLIFFHIIDGYMDLPSAIYSVFVIYFFYKFLDKYDYVFLLIGLLFGLLLVNLKNDGLVIYFPGIIFALITYLFIKKDFKKVFNGFFTKNNILITLFFILYFFIPSLFVKLYHGFGLNPIKDDGIDKPFVIHTEIFNYFDDIFILENNFNLVLLFILVLFVKHKKGSNLFLLLSSGFIFLLFLGVFLFTGNYQWVIDQTTVNRVFMSSFVILLTFFTIIKYEK